MSKKSFLNNNYEENNDVMTLEDLVNEDTEKASRYFLSLADEKQAKDTLSNMKKSIGLKVDARKAMLIESEMDGLQHLLEMSNNRNTLSKVEESIENTFDYERLMNAIEKKFKIIQMLCRMDSIDGQGTGGRINVGVQWQGNDGSSGFVIIRQE